MLIFFFIEALAKKLACNMLRSIPEKSYDNTKVKV